MLADFVLKGIDNLFNQKLSLQPQKKIFNKQVIKQNIQNVVKKGNLQSNYFKQNNTTIPTHKSRLRSILEHNRQQKISSVVKKGKNDRSNSPSPYTKIQRNRSMKSIKNNQFNNSTSNLSMKKQQSIITYYRQQRKTIQKSRISQCSNNQNYLIKSINNQENMEKRQKHQIQKQKQINQKNFMQFSPLNNKIEKQFLKRKVYKN